MLFNVYLVTDSGDEPYFLIREGLSTLFEHVGVPDMESIEDSISVNSENFLVRISHLIMMPYQVFWMVN